ncbi:MAG: Glycine oxidase ThiO [uncultured Thermomicrobiales bacterium]|uniref:Glycine oxidase ThiO n=1 Tax=uncultured Thermomicrobiales bacterium TaxID=1645740 RepID=A0A6J4V502_9BACT|nr:MAG: Glycine oxidase ThiO [uncultured Thermomicrobiales bacterium]
MGSSPDVLIIGGGIIGCAIGYELAKAGARVTIVERGQLASGASWASAGLISPPKRTPLGDAHARLEARSFNRYPTLLAELWEATGDDVEHNPAGRLSVALTAEEEADLRALIPWQRDLGFTVEWLTGDEARRLVPALSPAIRGGAWCAAASGVRAERLTHALARAAGLRGATIREETPVTGFLTVAGRVGGAQTAEGPLHAGETVIATGAWTAALGALLDLPLPTRPVRGQMLALAGVDPPLAHAVAGAGGFLIPRADGTVIAAATVEEAGFDTRVTPGGLGWLSTLVGTLAPVYAGARVVETWAGLRPATADDRPLMGRAPGHDGLWVAAGHMRDGVLWAPVTGELLAASILNGVPDPVLAPYDPARFARQGAAANA